MPNTNASPQQCEISAQVNYGLSSMQNALILDYNEPDTTTVLFYASTPQVVTANTNNSTFNLQTLFAGINTAVAIGWSDISNPGQEIDWGLALSGSRFKMNPNGFTLIRVNQALASLPTIYIDNPSVSVNALIQFFCLAN